MLKIDIISKSYLLTVTPKLQMVVEKYKLINHLSNLVKIN